MAVAVELGGGVVSRGQRRGGVVSGWSSDSWDGLGSTVEGGHSSPSHLLFESAAPGGSASYLPVWAAAGAMPCVVCSCWAPASHREWAGFFRNENKHIIRSGSLIQMTESSIAHFCLPRKNINQTRSSPCFSVHLCRLAFLGSLLNSSSRTPLVLLMTSKIPGPLCGK